MVCFGVCTEWVCLYITWFLLPGIYQGIITNNEDIALNLTFIAILIVVILFIIRFIWVYLWHSSFIKIKKNPLNNFFTGF